MEVNAATADAELNFRFPVAPDNDASKYVIVLSLPTSWDESTLGRGTLVYVDNAKHGGYANGTVAPTVCRPPSTDAASTTITLLGCLINDAVIVGVSYNKKLALCSILISGTFTTTVTKEDNPAIYSIDEGKFGVVRHGNRKLRCIEVEAIVNYTAGAACGECRPARNGEASAAAKKILTLHLT